jgi:hypothetical protein
LRSEKEKAFHSDFRLIRNIDLALYSCTRYR